MAYINRKNIIDKFEKLKEKAETLRDKVYLDGVLAVIECEPAADVYEEVHGHWIEDGEYQVCSECGEEHHWDEYRATYCEDCGAKMDGQ